MIDRPEAGGAGIDSNSPPSTPASRQDPRILEYARQLREQDSQTSANKPPSRGALGFNGPLPTPPDAHALPPLVDSGPKALDQPAVEAQPRPKEPRAKHARGVYLMGLMARLFLIGAGVMGFVAIASTALAVFDLALGAAVAAALLFIFGRLVRRRGSEQEIERRAHFGN